MCIETKGQYKVIDWNKFDECPDCHSKKVNHIEETHKKGRKSNENSYCMNCGAEWYLKRKGEVRQVIWHQVN